MTDHTMTCEQLDALLPDHLSAELDAAARTRVGAHLESCPRCATLVDDLRQIRADARALPTLRPSRDLWAGIAERIEAPVQAIDSAPRADRRPRVVLSRRWLAAAAAALVAVTAGVTREVVLRTAGPQVAAVDDTPRAGATSPSAAPLVAATTPAPPVMVAGTTPAQPPSRPAATSAAARRTGTATRGAAVELPASVLAASGGRDAEATYDREIDALRAIVGQRRAQLAPATIEVLERNLQIIDQAIAQSRTALAADPASSFLNRQLTTALEKKLMLLRTAALLPART